ncbi:hypothetical protein Tco_0590441 [Tanacetum coccineum]
MPSSSKLIRHFHMLENEINKLYTLLKAKIATKSIFFTNREDTILSQFCYDEVKMILDYLHTVFKAIQTEFLKEVKVMMDVFESMESELDETLKQNEILKDRLLEATLAEDVRNLGHKFLATTGKLTDFDEENYDFGSKITHLEKIIAQKTKYFDDVKLELPNRTAKFEAYFEKLKNTKVVLERQLAGKVEDSKAENDQFSKENNHLRTQLENLKGKSVETKFDKPSILGKSHADKLLITSQLSKSWCTPKIVGRKDLSNPVIA